MTADTLIPARRKHPSRAKGRRIPRGEHDPRAEAEKRALFARLSPLPEWWVTGRPETWVLERREKGTT